MKIHRYVLTNVPVSREQEVIGILMELVKKGIIELSDIHCLEEEPR